MSHSVYEKVGQAEADAAFESDGGSDDGILPRTSTDVRRRDEETLATEEEAERLLAGGEKAGSSRAIFGRDDGRQRSRRSKKKGRKQEEKREVVYEMEEGGPRSSSAESSGNSSEVDLARLSQTQARRKSKGTRCCKFAAIYIVIVAAFLALLYGAWRASHTKQSHGDEKQPPPAPAESSRPSNLDEKPAESKYKPQLLSNGTHTFAPTTLLVSLDGFRADFLHRNLTPILSSFVRAGVSPKYMWPSFPSLTFPNHFTLVTGLHPESHGVVGNTFWDPDMQKEFYYTDPARSMQPEWWNAEPIWVTAEKSGVKTGVHMWPGSEVEGGIESVEASYVDEFNGDEHLENKVKKILGWLDLPSLLDEPGQGVAKVKKALRPQLIAAYVPNVDADGHLYGPNSTYIRSTIAEVDGMLGSLFQGIEERNLTDIINIIIVSDHGMATTSVNRLIQLEDLIDTSLIEHIDGWPLYGLRPFDQSEEQLQKLYRVLMQTSKLPKYKHAFDVYLRDQDMPERYHFAHNYRIAPLWIVPKAGWALVTKEEFDVAQGLEKGEAYSPRGLHGYDNLHPLMRAIFVARGPAFPHLPGSQLEPFQNTEVYNIVCDSLGIQPMANNGTLRLPLKPSGLHDFDEATEVPDDPQDDPSLALPPEVPKLASPHGDLHAQTSLPAEVPKLANRPDFMVPTEGVPPVSPTSPVQSSAITGADKPTKPEQVGQPNRPVEGPEGPAATRPVVHDKLPEDEKEDVNRWWDWVNGKLDAIKGWANTLFKGKDGAADKEGGQSDETQGR